MNTISFYMRNLRAVYNRAVEKELVIQRFPFRHVYTRVERTTKRAVPLACDKTAHDIGPVTSSGQEVCKGHAASQFLHKGDVHDPYGVPEKEGSQQRHPLIPAEKNRSTTFCKMGAVHAGIVDRYNIPGSPYLLPIIARPGMDERKQYINASHRINRYLKAIGKELGLSVPLTHYVARHSWASAARSKNIPISVISEGMGHDSENTTRIYLASLDTTTIDKANRLILNSLCRE